MKFVNHAPEDSEWTAHIDALNNWTDPERLLRSIVQYARSGPFYPADMHVDLIQQCIAAERVEAEHMGAIKSLIDLRNETYGAGKSNVARKDIRRQVNRHSLTFTEERYRETYDYIFAGFGHPNPKKEG